MLTLGELASRLELEFLGDSAVPIKGIASLDAAGPEHLSFVSEKKTPGAGGGYQCRCADFAP